MNELYFFITLAVLVVLLIVMSLRMRKLYKKSIYESGEYRCDELGRSDYLEIAQRFVSEELLEVKPKAPFLNTELEASYDEAVSYYLIGFVDDLAAYFSITDEEKNKLLMSLLKTSLDLSAIQMIRYCTDVTKAKSSSHVAELVKIGGIAFYAWMEKKDVPLGISMKVQVNNYVLMMRRAQEPARVASR